MKKDLDLLIIGAGPAGLIAAKTAAECGLSYLVLERGMIAQTVYEYPIAQPMHSPSEDVELSWGGILAVGLPTREEVLSHYLSFAVDQKRLAINTRESVESIERGDGGLTVRSSKAQYKAKNVVVATGGFGIPRRLNVPGETADRVSYQFKEGAPFAGKEVLVIGGGNSAAEAALFLCEAAARVTLSLRRPTLAPLDPNQDPITVVMPANRVKLESLAARKKITILYSSQVKEVARDAAFISVKDQPNPVKVPCDHIFAMIGADPDVSLLRSARAEIAPDRRPVYNTETHETTVRGLYVIGHLSRQLHMKNAIRLTPGIIRRIAGAGELAEPGMLARLVGTMRIRSRFTKRLIRKSPAVLRALQSLVSPA